MNYFRQPYDPMQAMASGMALWGGMGQAYDAQMARAQRQRERDALMQLGQSDQLLGFEENPMAIRPDAVKALYASGNPDLAFKAEALASQPHLLDREMRRAEAMMGMDEARALRMMPHEVERAKQLKQAEIDAKMGAWKEMMPSMFGGGMPRPTNALARPASVAGAAIGGPDTGVSTNGIGELDQALTGQGLSGLSGGSSEMEFDLNRGPVMKFKQSSPLEEEKMRRELLLKGEDTYLKQQETRETLRKNQVAELNQAHERVYTLTQAKKDLELRRANGDIDPVAAQSEMNELNAEIAAAKEHRSALQEMMGGRTPKAATAQSAPPQAQPAAQPARPAQAKNALKPIGSGLPYKMQQELNSKTEQKKIDIATGSIEEAHAEAGKFAMHMPTLHNLMNLVSTKDVGNRLGQIPGGEMVLRIASEDNDNLQKWRNELIDVMKKEGQSQLMNTLPELAIVSDMFPSVTNSPDTNKKSMANVMNLAEATMAAPQFLENWAAQHGGSLDGARGMFREWMNKNKRYSVESKGGKSSMYDNEIIPLEAWAKLRQRFTANDIAKRKAAGKIQVLNGRVFFEE